MTNKERLAKVSATKQKQFAKSIEHVDIKELKRMYLDENKSYEYIRQFYQLTGYTLDKILRENNIKKPRKQSASLVLETKYTKAGSKEKYDAQTYKTTCENIIARGKTLEEHYSEVGDKCSAAWAKKSPEEIQSFIDKHYESYFLDSAKIQHAKEIRKETNVKRYGVDNTYKLATYVSDSAPNKEFAQLLTKHGYDFHSELFLPIENGKGYRYDFAVGTNLIEIDPWPFHNSTWSPIPTAHPVDKKYHLQKTETAIKHGYRCIHIFDWDNVSKIVDSLQHKKKIFARKCTVKNVDKETVDKFLNKYHFQNTCNGQKICYGLYYNNELIQVMTFGKARYNRNYEYELLRLCTRSDYIVVGGAEKLFNYFVVNHNPISIISYCDNAKFSGSVYQRIGLTKISNGSPTRHWYHPELKEHITDNFLRQRGFDQLFGNIFGCYGKGTNNNELMLKHGFVEVYDCGQSVYSWNRVES